MKKICRDLLSLAVLLILLSGLFVAGKVKAAETSFCLKRGDYVCFYGDSITEQRYYGVDVETYVHTRFPDLNVKFINSGVGGDTVRGGFTGGINERLKRDVFPYKPNIITIMLGMNDASYRPFDENDFCRIHQWLRTHHSAVAAAFAPYLHHPHSTNSLR